MNQATNEAMIFPRNDDRKYFGYDSCTASYTKCNNLLVSISYKNVSISSNKLKLMYWIAIKYVAQKSFLVVYIHR